MATSADASLHLTISGRVQGVGFRWSMSEAAAQLGLRGWVRNRRDGSVEAVALGAPAALTALRDWARAGPPQARILELVERRASERELALVGQGFAQRPTE